ADGFAYQLAGLRVPLADVLAGCGGVRIDHAVSFAADVTLVGGDIRALDRPASEGGAFNLPVFVTLLLEILEDDIRALFGRLLLRGGFGRTREQYQARFANDAITARTGFRPAALQASCV